MGSVPDSFLDSLHSLVVYSDEFDVMISGDLVADSVRSFRQRLADPHDPILGHPLVGVGQCYSFLVLLRGIIGVVSSVSFGFHQWASGGGVSFLGG